nr:P-loop NTPase fold protein [Nitrospina gracilis]
MGYKHFAKYVAKSICHMVPLEGVVYGINGEWGAGKSTLANFIISYLQDKEFLKEEGVVLNAPIIMEFNPWLFYGKGVLASQFLKELQWVLVNEGILKGYKVFGYDYLIKIQDLLSKTKISFWTQLLWLLPCFKHKNIKDLKGEIGDILKKKNRKVLVVIDDIDRLAIDEIIELFKLIKIIADFPNIIYLLCFEKKVVVNALKEFQKLPGDSYLEKIVQNPLDLPNPDETQLKEIISKRFGEVLGSKSEEFWGDSRTADMYYEVIVPLFNTPRHINRFINSLHITYPAIKDQVNLVDFICIELMRVFIPDAYEIVRNNKSYFVARSGFDSVSSDKKKEKIEPFHKEWFDRFGQAKSHKICGVTKKALMLLFPLLEQIWGGFTLGSDSEREWANDRRMCSEEYFEIYFRLSLSVGDFSVEEISSIVDLADDPKVLANKLNELGREKLPAGGSRLGRLLDVLEHWTDERIEVSKIHGIIKAFYLLGDKADLDEDKQGIFGLGNFPNISRKIHQLFRRINLDQKYQIIADCFGEAPISSFMLNQFQGYAIQHGRWKYTDRKSPTPPFREEDFDELERKIKKKILDAKNSNRLVDLGNLHLALLVWENLEGCEEECYEWARQMTAEEDGLVKLLEGFLSSVIRDGEKFYQLKPDSLKPFLEPSEIYPRAKQILENNGGLAEMQKIALETFIRDYEAQAEESSE